MSDSSDIDITGPNDQPNFTHSGTIYEDVLSISSDDSKDSFNKPSKKRKNELERRRRNDVSNTLRYLQAVILDGQPKEEQWNQQVTLSAALKLCQILKSEDNKYLLESETLLQQNIILKQKLRKLKKEKKRKSSSVSLGTVAPSSAPGAPKLETPAKRRSTDSVNVSNDKLVVQPEVETSNTLKNDNAKNKCEATPTDSANVKCENFFVKPQVEASDKLKIDLLKKEHEAIPKLSRKSKKKPLTEEEEEYRWIEERIDELTKEVDDLWNEIKDDEEISHDEYLTLISHNVCSANSENVSSSNSENSNSEDKVLSNADDQKSNPQLPRPSPTEGVKEKRGLISVTDITKLMRPEILMLQEKSVPSSTESTSHYTACNLKGNESSGDDSPRLVIDEGVSIQNSDQEIDIIEALEAVDNLCRSLVGDDPSAETETLPSMYNIQLKDKRKQENSTISDVIVID